MLSRWWQARVLKRAHDRFAESDWNWIRDALPILDGLTEDEWSRLADLALLFLREKTLEQVQGLELDDRQALLIAVQAALPILELGLDWYRGWYAVVVYPGQFVPSREYVDEHGLVWVDDEAKSGEAWERGPVLVSWDDVEAGLDADGYNVILHEMAHKLDMRDGAPNGCPPLHAGMSVPDWSRALSAAYDDLCRRADAGEDTPIDPYATESPAELFAVVSEAFFEVPDLLFDEYPEVYEQLKTFYRQDTLARLRAAVDAEELARAG